MYTCDPESQENADTMILVFFNQLTPDIKRKLQRLERLREKSRDLVVVALKHIMEGIVQKERKLKRCSARTNISLMCCCRYRGTRGAQEATVMPGG